MRQHRIVLLPGDGIGPEITAVTKDLLKAVSQKHGFKLILDEKPIGGCLLYTSDAADDTTSLDLGRRRII